MLITTGPLTAAGMPLQRVPNGFLAKRMRPAERSFPLSADALDDIDPIRVAGLVLPDDAIARPAEWSPPARERALGRPLPRTVIPSRFCQAGSGSAAEVRP